MYNRLYSFHRKEIEITLSDGLTGGSLFWFHGENHCIQDLKEFISKVHGVAVERITLRESTPSVYFPARTIHARINR
jgi:hypothetical protein